jgi:hypothetical protein
MKKSIKRPVRGATLLRVIIFLLGISIIVYTLLTNDGSKTSMIMLIVGVLLAFTVVMFIFLSPSRVLRDDVVDAIVLPNITNINNFSILRNEGGLYIPINKMGIVKVFIPTATTSNQISPPDTGNVSFGEQGILLDPPGQGLLLHSYKTGATFAEEDMEDIIIDLMVNSMELASKVMVARSDDTVRVTLKGLVNLGLCQTIRKDNPELCTQIGCPICSFLAGIIAVCTNRRTRIVSATVKDNTVTTVFQLL